MLRADGMTVPDIAQRLGVSKSSVSLWVRDVDFTPLPRVRARRRGPNTLQRRKQAEIDELLAEGVKRIAQLSDREFLVAGAALYAGEGNKGDGSARVTNSNPRIVGSSAHGCGTSTRSMKRDFAYGSTSTKDSTSMRQSSTGRGLPAFRPSSSAKPSGQCQTLRSGPRSTSMESRASATVAPERIGASWAWCTRCSAR